MRELCVELSSLARGSRALGRPLRLRGMAFNVNLLARIHISPSSRRAPHDDPFRARWTITANAGIAAAQYHAHDRGTTANPTSMASAIRQSSSRHKNHSAVARDTTKG